VTAPVPSTPRFGSLSAGVPVVGVPVVGVVVPVAGGVVVAGGVLVVPAAGGVVLVVVGEAVAGFVVAGAVVAGFVAGAWAANATLELQGSATRVAARTEQWIREVNEAFMLLPGFGTPTSAEYRTGAAASQAPSLRHEPASFPPRSDLAATPS